MAEEKVGFGFEFGVKGDKEVKRGLEDIIRLMAGAGNATSAVASILGRGAGLFELGKMAGPLGLAATAMAAFAYKSAEAGENLRKTRYQLELLSRVPVSALTDSDLAGNESAVVEQFRNLGLEAGNTFQLSFMDRLMNFGGGAAAVTWDVGASLVNLLGGYVKSYEQSSQQAKDAIAQVRMDQEVGTQRINVATQTQQALAAIHRKTAKDIAELYSMNFLSRPGQPGIGVMPESFVGMIRQREIRGNADRNTGATLQKQIDFDNQQLSNLRNAPVPIVPGSSPADQLQDTAKRASDIQSLEAKINDELSKQLDSRQDILELEMQQRQQARDFIKSQDYGSWRSVGGGGRSLSPEVMSQILGFRGLGHKNDSAMPTDVGYDTSRSAASILANEKAAAVARSGTANADPNQKTYDAVSASVANFNDLAGAAKYVGVNFDILAAKLADTSLGKEITSMEDSLSKGVGVVEDSLMNFAKMLSGSSIGEWITKQAEAAKKGAGVIKDYIEGAPAGVQKDHPKPIEQGQRLEDSAKRGWDALFGSNYKIPPSSFRNLTASLGGNSRFMSDSDMGLYRDSFHLGPSSGFRLGSGHGGFRTGGANIRSMIDMAPLPSQYRHASDFSSSQKYAEEFQRLNILGSYQRSLSAHYDPSFRHGSINDDVLGPMNRRVKDWSHPMAGFGGIGGSIGSLDVLKSIDKNINKIGIPTLAN